MQILFAGHIRIYVSEVKPTENSEMQNERIRNCISNLWDTTPIPINRSQLTSESIYEMFTDKKKLNTPDTQLLTYLDFVRFLDCEPFDVSLTCLKQCKERFEEHLQMIICTVKVWVYQKDDNTLEFSLVIFDLDNNFCFLDVREVSISGMFNIIEDTNSW